MVDITKKQLFVALTFVLFGLGAAANCAAQTPPPTTQELQCMARGWQRVVRPVSGLQRVLLWKGPVGSWTKGAIIVMHGGGGHHNNFCVANVPLIEPQVRFTDLAIEQGFAVFLLNSSEVITDNQGRPVGKVWDDEVRNRPNVDLPFIGEVLSTVIPQARPAGSRAEIFMTGLSSGGYMTVRASTHFDNLVTAFAPLSSGDPYGWNRVVTPGVPPRPDGVSGEGFDNDTGKRIFEINSCRWRKWPNREKPWETTNPAVKPTFRIFHHENDGINDLSCSEKVGKFLRRRGYPSMPDFRLTGGVRSLANHYWQDGYNLPLLEFFSSQIGNK